MYVCCSWVRPVAAWIDPARSDAVYSAACPSRCTPLYCLLQTQAPCPRRAQIRGTVYLSID